MFYFQLVQSIGYLERKPPGFAMMIEMFEEEMQTLEIKVALNCTTTISTLFEG